MLFFEERPSPFVVGFPVHLKERRFICNRDFLGTTGHCVIRECFRDTAARLHILNIVKANAIFPHIAVYGVFNIVGLFLFQRQTGAGKPPEFAVKTMRPFLS